ncbi:MAG: hypothetical protein ACK2TU_12575 [Anaerolineales bacterium]
MKIKHALLFSFTLLLIACNGSNDGSVTDLQPANVVMGSTKDTVFYEGELSVSVGEGEYLSQSGLATVVAELKFFNGDYYNEPALVTFTSDKAAEGLATIDPVAEAENGTAKATYSPFDFSGVDTIYASTVIDGIERTASVKVTVALPNMLSILFDCSDPEYIGIRGTGEMGIPEVSKVTFKVTNEYGKGVADKEVDFHLNTLVPGISLSPETGYSDNEGYVSTFVRSGDFPTTVRVSAVIKENSVSTQSDYLIVSTGLPDQNSFFITTGVPGIKNEYGIPIRIIDIPPGEDTINIFVIASDHFNNPVPDGTAIYFTTTCGQIDDKCYTSNGECNVEYDSLSIDGTCSNAGILAIAIGEETFKDLNSNGVYDIGDAQIDDIGEPWLDEINFGVFDLGQELFWDQNGNGIRDWEDREDRGFYNGILCRNEFDEEGNRVCYQDLLYVMSQAIVNPSN